MNMKLFYVLILLALSTVLTLPLFAQEAETESEAEEKNISSMRTTTDVSLDVTTLPEVRVAFSEKLIFPFMAGTSPLTKGNNITIGLNAKLSPVSFSFIPDAVWTPIAFFNFSLGGRVGTGWNYQLFGGRMNGLGKNTYGQSLKEDGITLKEPITENDTPGGVVWAAHAGTTLQADFGAIFPGDWHHVVVKIYNEFGYEAYSAITDGSQWFYENNDGINQNCFSYYGSFFLGYQMPLFVDLVGLMYEIYTPIYNPYSDIKLSDRGSSGTASLAADFKIKEVVNIMLLLQFNNGLKDAGTFNYDREWQFFRVVASTTWHIKR
jgi:hypothetical protein